MTAWGEVRADVLEMLDGLAAGAGVNGGPRPDREAVAGWLHGIYGSADAGWLTITRSEGGVFLTDWVAVGDLGAGADIISERAAVTQVWVGAATRRERLGPGDRGGAADCLALPGLWLDVDIRHPVHKETALPADADDAGQLVARFPLAPTAILDTGHGWQVWWCFAEPVNLDDLQDRGAALLDRWEATWVRLAGERDWSVDHVWDLARMLRPAGSVNRKAEPVPVVVVAADWGRRVGLDDLDDLLDPRPAREAPHERSGSGTGTRPGDKWAAAHTWEELLTADGATFHRNAESRLGPYQQWRRPGVDDRPGGTVGYGGSDVLKVFSSGWQVVDPATGVMVTLKQNETYTRFGYWAATRYGGDLSAAAAALRADGWGETPEESFQRLAAGLSCASTPPLEGMLPDTFWSALPALEWIRQAAHARQRSAEAVLQVVLARMSGIAPHTLRLPGIVGAPAPLCYFAAIIAAPGVGKSTADAIGSELLPAPDYVADHLPLGSGEGLAEVLFDWVDERDEEGKRRKVRRQVRNNAIVYVDEGQALAELGARSGSTLLPTIRTIWTGAAIGNTNASVERRRIVPRSSYTYGLVLGLQPGRAGRLLDDADAGTPQRFGFALAVDPTVPDVPPPWPGPLEWTPPPEIKEGGDFKVCEAVAAEVRAADLSRVRGQVPVDPLDAHSGLYRLKVAALLGLLDVDRADRRTVTEADWELARILKAQSDAVRAALVAAVADEGARREQATRRRQAERAVATATAVELDRTVRAALAIAAKVAAEPDRWTVGDLRGDLRRWREEYSDGLAHAIHQGWVVEVTEAGQGTDKRCLRPGPTPVA